MHHPCLIQAYWGNGDSVFCVYAVLVLPRSLSFCCCCCLCSGGVSSWLCVIPFPQCTDCARQTAFSAIVFSLTLFYEDRAHFVPHNISSAATGRPFCVPVRSVPWLISSACSACHLFGSLASFRIFWFWHLLVLAFFSNFVTVSPISLSAGCFSLCRKHEE